MGLLVASKSDGFGGLFSQVPALKVGVPNVGSKPFTSQGEAQVLSSVLIVGLHTRDGIYGKLCLSLPTCFDVVSLGVPDVKVAPTSFSFSEEVFQM